MTRPVKAPNSYRRTLQCFGLVLSLCLSNSATAELTASLQTTSPKEGEPLEIYLQSDLPSPSAPDLSSLPADFELLDNRMVTVSSYGTGQKTTSTRWIIRLRPRHAGELQLPALTAGGETSLPLTIMVAATEPRVYAQPEPADRFWLDSELQQDQVYIGSQVLLTLRLYQQGKALEQANFIPPQTPLALIRPLAAAQPQQSGQNRQLLSQVFALFPRQPGELTLPPFTLSGIDESGNPVELSSDSIRLTVLPPPYQSNRHIWLPALDIQLSEEFSPPQQAEVGGAFERILILRAVGLPAARLPELTRLQHEQARIELLAVNLSEEDNSGNLISERRERIRITPAAEGTLQLPAIDLPWWDTSSNQGRHASLPARKIGVTAPPRATNPVQEELTTSFPTANDTNGQDNLLIWVLTLISLVSTLALIYSVNRLYRLRNPKPQIPTYPDPVVDEGTDHMATQPAPEESSPPAAPQPLHLNREEKAFYALANACRERDAKTARLLLLNWSQLYWQEGPPDSLEQIGQRAKNQALNLLIMELEQCLFTGNTHSWQGERLLEGLQRLRQQN